MNLESIEERLLFSTVRIESLNDAGHVISIGTGFIIIHKMGEDANKAYIISNKHVLLASQIFRVRFIKRKNSTCLEPELGETVSFKFRYSNSYIEIHPDPNTDIAAIDISGFVERYQTDIYFQALDYDMLLTGREEYLHVTQNVIFIGYPDNRYDQKTNLPLVRTATVASHPYFDFNGMKAFVVDGQVFPGSSGSPVLINPNKEEWMCGRMPKAEKTYYILGIIARTMLRNNKLQVLDTRLVDNASVQEVIGLGIVFKATEIKYVLDSASEKYFGGLSKKSSEFYIVEKEEN